jgi:hypothetical protein
MIACAVVGKHTDEFDYSYRKLEQPLLQIVFPSFHLYLPLVGA